MTTTLPGNVHVTSSRSYTSVVNGTTTNGTTQQDTNETATTGIIAGVITGAVIVILSIIVLCAWRIHRNRQSTSNYTYEEVPLNPNISEPNATSSYAVNAQGFFDDLKKTLIDISKKVTEKIPMSPAQTFRYLPVELLYAKVVIKTDERYVRMGREYFEESNTEKEQKIIEHPDDIFYKYGKPTKRIFMIGNAAHGKTTYCLWLLQHWVNSQNNKEGKMQHNEWEKEVGKFDLVFLIRLRDIMKSTTNVIDMISRDILKMKKEEHIKRFMAILKSGTYRSLILIDGLDEWKPDQNVTEDERFKGLPFIEDIENCVILISMRPWKFEEVSKDVNSDDRVIEILGLDENGIQKMTENILLNYYELKVEERSEDSLKYIAIMNKLKHTTLNSLMKIPLLAVLCVQIWYNGEEIGNSLTSFYTAMVEMLIDRTQKSFEIDNEVESSLKQFQNYEYLLLKLGKLAYKGLISSKYMYEFPVQNMLEEIEFSRRELYFLLNVGLLSKEETDSTMTRNVKLYFFHASLQEYLCAKYVIKNDEIRKPFLEHLSTIKVILEFGNVLIFLSGLDPSLGSEISKHIVSVANADTEINGYRKFNMAFFSLDNSVKLLYNLKASCYRELTYTQSRSGSLAVPYHVSDVYVDDDSNIETFRASADILIHHHADITSLYLFKVPEDVDNGIPDSILKQYLDHTVSLQSLYINGYNTNRTLHHISDIFSSLTVLVLYDITLSPDAISTLQSALNSNTVIQTLGLRNIKTRDNKDEDYKPSSLSGIIQILPDLPRLSTLRIQITHKDDKPVLLEVLSRLSHLHGIHYVGTYPRDNEYDHDIVQTLCTSLGLRWLTLSFVYLGDSGLHLPHDMLHLETVVLFEVDMIPSAFIQSVINVNHKLYVILVKRNIDEECLTLIRSSPHLRINMDNVRGDGIHELSFTRVWPPSK